MQFSKKKKKKKKEKGLFLRTTGQVLGLLGRIWILFFFFFMPNLNMEIKLHMKFETCLTFCWQKIAFFFTLHLYKEC